MGATKYNRAIHDWDVTKVRSFRSMFENTFYNRDLSAWKMSSAVDLDRMFYNASTFRQSLCPWSDSISTVASVKDLFHGTNCPDTSDPDLKGLRVSLCYTQCASVLSKSLTSSDTMFGVIFGLLIALSGFVLRRRFGMFKRHLASKYKKNDAPEVQVLMMP